MNAMVNRDTIQLMTQRLAADVQSHCRPFIINSSPIIVPKITHSLLGYSAFHCIVIRYDTIIRYCYMRSKADVSMKPKIKNMEEKLKLHILSLAVLLVFTARAMLALQALY